MKKVYHFPKNYARIHWILLHLVCRLQLLLMSFVMRSSKQEMNSKFLPAYYGALLAETIRSLL
jgi:hypothetical protein